MDWQWVNLWVRLNQQHQTWLNRPTALTRWVVTESAVVGILRSPLQWQGTSRTSLPHTSSEPVEEAASRTGITPLTSIGPGKYLGKQFKCGHQQDLGNEHFRKWRMQAWSRWNCLGVSRWQKSRFHPLVWVRSLLFSAHPIIDSLTYHITIATFSYPGGDQLSNDRCYRPGHQSCLRE